MTGRRSNKGRRRHHPIERSARALVYRDPAERRWALYGRWLAWFRRKQV